MARRAMTGWRDARWPDGATRDDRMARRAMTGWRDAR